jgi:cytosine/uracil/thiamine/allantoin permease
MDYKQLALASGSVFGVMVIAGMIISLLSTQLQCSKIGWGSSALQGVYSAFLPTIVYAIATYSPMIRRPFSSTFETFGVSPDKSDFLGTGYLVMITSWVSVVWNINKSEKAVCKPDLKEMTDFKKKLMSELYLKEKEKQTNAEKK